eukprot:m.186067 g.186067  ORF g.186067 m.186067 type:complete len:82 (+) comp14746_c0_seq2:1922-2167(+)
MDFANVHTAHPIACLSLSTAVRRLESRVLLIHLNTGMTSMSPIYARASVHYVASSAPQPFCMFSASVLNLHAPHMVTVKMR